MSSYDEDISLVYDEINVYGPMTRYGIIDKESNSFALSNLVAEGFTSGYATTKEESIILVSSSSGTLSFKTIVSLEAEELNTEDKIILGDITRTITRGRYHQGIDPDFCCFNHLVSIHVSCSISASDEQRS